MNALDSVRAARNLDDAHVGTDFAVWGHSQGGQASLFTGQLAKTYATELHLVGVAAGAPAANLVERFKVKIETTVGKILVSMALRSWSQVYDDAELDQIVTPTARPVVENIAENCLYNQAQILSSVPGSLALKLSFLSTPPWDVAPWKSILAENTPGATPTGVPILITQGDADPIVAPETTAQLVDGLCGNGETVDYQLLPGVATWRPAMRPCPKSPRGSPTASPANPHPRRANDRPSAVDWMAAGSRGRAEDVRCRLGCSTRRTRSLRRDVRVRLSGHAPGGVSQPVR